MLQSSWSIAKTVYEVYLTTSLLAIKAWLFHETYIKFKQSYRECFTMRLKQGCPSLFQNVL